MSAKQQIVSRDSGIINTIQQDAFHSSSSFYSSLDAQICAPSYDIEVHNLNLPGRGRGIYYSDRYCFLEYVELPEHKLKVRYPGISNHQSSIGKLIFIPPGVELEWHWEKGAQRTITCMFEVERLDMCAGYDWHWGNIDLSKTFNIQNDYLLMGMRKLGEEACSPGFASDLQIENMLAVMGIELYREFIKREALIAVDADCLSKNQLQNLQQYIYSNLSREISLEAIGSHCGISARELSRRFKSAMGITLRQYVANARVNKAKQLLANQQLMIKQVGYECGFRGPAAFVAAFRKTTGVTPAEYRKSHC